MTARKRWLVGALALGLRAQGAGAMQFRRLGDLLAGLSLAVLPPEQRGHLSVSAYDARGRCPGRDAFPWEAAWFAADLPPAPARVLVGGAGQGREAGWLAARGYDVVAFDPAPSLVRRALAQVTRLGCRAFLRGSYEDLVEPGDAAARAFADAIAFHAPYDAVVLGWGSFTHVGAGRQRLALLRRMHVLCPRGPVLASVWMRADEPPRVRSRAFQVGFRLGRLGRATEAPAVEPGDWVLGTTGYAHYFTAAEFAALADSAGYRVTRPPDPAQPDRSPHATLRPR